MATSGFPLDTAELVGTLIESTLYGGAVFATWRTISDLHTRSDTGIQVNWVFRAAPWAMIFLATLHISVDWYRSIHAFTQLPAREERVLFLINLANWSYPLKDGLYAIQTYMGDAIVIYRAFLVWERNWWVVVVPCLSWLVTFATGIGIITSEAQANLLFIGRLKTFISASFLSMVVTTVFSTGAIMLRVYRTRRATAYLHSHPATSANNTSTYLTRIVALILQSGLIYCLTVILVFSFFQAGSNIQYIPFNGLSSLIPLLFSNIILGTNAARRRGANTTTTSGSHSHSRAAELSANKSYGVGGRPFEVGVNVTQLVEVSRDSLKASPGGMGGLRNFGGGDVKFGGVSGGGPGARGGYTSASGLSGLSGVPLNPAKGASLYGQASPYGMYDGHEHGDEHGDIGAAV